MSGGLTFWRYRRPFTIDGKAYVVVMRARTNGLVSELRGGGEILARDATPIGGPDAVRNHALETRSPDGSSITVEAGYISSVNVGIRVRKDGGIVHESHPGVTIAYPEKYRAQALAMGGDSIGSALRGAWDEGMSANNYDPTVWKRNKIPLAVDIALGLLFFVIAKLTDLTTAALAGAAVGIVLLVAQRMTKVDLLGGLAMFGIVMLLISAGLALMFQSDDAVKYRTTAIGLLSATLFFGDGLAGGRRLASRLKRYLPYTDIDVARLGIGMGLLGATMAGLNLIVAVYTSTDFWLFYSTFADFIVTMVLILLVFRFARGEMLRDLSPQYNPSRTQ